MKNNKETSKKLRAISLKSLHPRLGLQQIRGHFEIFLEVLETYAYFFSYEIYASRQLTTAGLPIGERMKKNSHLSSFLGLKNAMVDIFYILDWKLGAKTKTEIYLKFCFYDSVHNRLN